MKRKKLLILFGSLIVLSATAIIAHSSIMANVQDVDSVQASSADFADVKESDWFYDDVAFVKESNLMSGISDDLFSPNDTTTRGMIVTVLWRLENKPDEKNCTFTDIADNAYYYKAVCWANKNKIVSGYDEKTFGPDDYITREQLATIMYRYANYKNYDISAKSSLDKYKDLQDVSEYAVSAFEWANANGIITGTTEEALSPKGNALRCQVAAIFKRFCSLYCDMKDVKDSNTKSVTTGDEHNRSSSGISNSGTTSKDIHINQNVPTIIVDNASAKPGDEIQVKVKAYNNPGILGMTLSVYFDEEKFKLVSVENGEAFKDVLNLTPANILECGSNFLWDGMELKDTDIKDGDILLLNFKVFEQAAEGKYPLTIKVNNGDIVDSRLNPITMQIENGYINVLQK